MSRLALAIVLFGILPLPVQATAYLVHRYDFRCKSTIESWQRKRNFATGFTPELAAAQTL